MGLPLCAQHLPGSDAHAGHAGSGWRRRPTTDLPLLDPVRDIPVLADLARRGRLDLDALVTRRIGIDDVEQAFADMAAGRGARSVVCF